MTLVWVSTLSFYLNISIQKDTSLPSLAQRTSREFRKKCQDRMLPNPSGLFSIETLSSSSLVEQADVVRRSLNRCFTRSATNAFSSNLNRSNPFSESKFILYVCRSRYDGSTQCLSGLQKIKFYGRFRNLVLL